MFTNIYGSKYPNWFEKPKERGQKLFIMGNLTLYLIKCTDVVPLVANVEYKCSLKLNLIKYRN